MIIKVCGLRETVNMQAISALAVDWLGLIFYPRSARYVGVDERSNTALRESGLRNYPQKRVGVFVNADPDDVRRAVDDFDLDLVQLHGDETPAYCADLQGYWATDEQRDVELIKVFSVGGSFDFTATDPYTKYCRYFLFDTKSKQRGGTGRQFNWQLLEDYHGSTPFLLSGGIGPQDAAAILTLNHPRLAGIDLNSRFEVEPGLKNVEELADFVSQIRSSTANKV